MRSRFTPSAATALLLASGADAQVRLARQLTNFPSVVGGCTVVAQPPGESRRLYCAVRTGSWTFSRRPKKY